MINIRKEAASNNIETIIKYMVENKDDTLQIKRAFFALKTSNNGIALLNTIIPHIIGKIEGDTILNVIYNMPELEHYTIYLIYQKGNNLKDISHQQISYFLNRSTMWQDFIIKNMNTILKENKLIKLKTIFTAMVTNDKLETKMTSNLSGAILRDYAQYLLITDIKKANTYIKGNVNKLIYDTIITEDIIPFEEVPTNRNKLADIRELESLLDDLIYHGASDQNINAIATIIVNNFAANNVASIMHDRNYDNFDTFLSKNLDLIIHNTKDTRIIHYAKNNNILDSSLEDKYNLILQLMASGNHNENKHIYAITDAIMNNNLDTYVSNIFNQFAKNSNYDLNQIGRGATSTVYRIDDYVIKLGTRRFSFDCPKHYRIAPSQIRKQITNENGEPVFYVEVQNFYSSEGINRELIYQLLLDLYNDGIEVTDPITLAMYYNNFAFLDSPSQMNNSTKEKDEDKGYIYLGIDIKPSNNFIKNPLVIIDTDLMYPVQVEKKKFFPEQGYPLLTHKKALERYEKSKVKTYC